jgi:hypothetical protein
MLAQSWYPKHNFTFGAGAGLPKADLNPFFGDSAGLSVGYGYRFHPNFQVDVGLDTLFGAAGIREFLDTEIGYLRIKDYQFLVPFGGRVIVPLGSRVLFSGGGGGSYMRYSERLRQPSSYFSVECPVCRSRDGWGYYALLNTRFALDSRKLFWLGASGKVYRGHTEGEAFGEVPRIRTRDHWVNLFGEFGLSF